MSAVTKYVPSGAQHREPGVGEPGDERSRWCCRPSRKLGEVAVRQRQRHRDGRLQRGGVDEGEELLHPQHRRDQRPPGRSPSRPSSPYRRRSCRPRRSAASAPASRAGVASGTCAASRVGEDQVLVHLVGDRVRVELLAQLGDQRQLVGGEDLAGRVVRRVEQHQPGARAERRAQLAGSKAYRPSGRGAASPAAGPRRPGRSRRRTSRSTARSRPPRRPARRARGCWPRSPRSRRR